MLYKLVQSRAELVDKNNPTEVLKAVKNPVELEHIRDCYIKDSAVLTKVSLLDEGKCRKSSDE